MEILFERKEFKGNFVNVYETSQIIMGFTELHFSFRDLTLLLNPYRLSALKQVHSEIILLAGQVKRGSQGDGIILEKGGTGAVIKTADCTPLFFWYPRDGEDKPGTGRTTGGVVHIGWRGLLLGIEQKLLELLKDNDTTFDPRKLNIFLGPSIEKNCYQVGADLYELFSSKKYREDIFYPLDEKAAPGTGLYDNRAGGEPGDRKGKYWLDIKKGIRHSLKESGISDRQVGETGLCTFCEASRFPSYRRCPGSGRIYNFLVLK